MSHAGAVIGPSGQRRGGFVVTCGAVATCLASGTQTAALGTPRTSTGSSDGGERRSRVDDRKKASKDKERVVSYWRTCWRNVFATAAGEL